MAEESRLHYITHCVDYINDICNSNNTHIYGGIELKTQLLNDFSLKIKIKTENKFHEFNKNTIHNPYFSNLIELNCQLNNEDNEDKFNYIVECIDINPDILAFSENEIDESINNIEYIVIIDKIDSKILNDIKNKYINKNIYILNGESKSFSKLKEFNIIAKKYY